MQSLAAVIAREFVSPSRRSSSAGIWIRYSSLVPTAALSSTERSTTTLSESGIKTERLRQLELSNAKAAAEAAARSGRYVLATDAKQEQGRVAARLMSVFEASLTEFANAIMGAPPATSRDALRTLRASWRAIRIRQAKASGEEAVALPPLLEDEDNRADSERAPVGA